jgi:hypothetical protein
MIQVKTRVRSVTPVGVARDLSAPPPNFWGKIRTENKKKG